MSGVSTADTTGQNAKISSATPIHRRAPITRCAKSWSRRKSRTETWCRAPKVCVVKARLPCREFARKSALSRTLILMAPFSQYRHDQCDRLEHNGADPAGYVG